MPPDCKGTILEDPLSKPLTLADSDLGGALDMIIDSLDRHRCLKGSTITSRSIGVIASDIVFGGILTGLLNGTSANLLLTSTEEDPLQQYHQIHRQ